jgi:hypothetical protein
MGHSVDPNKEEGGGTMNCMASTRVSWSTGFLPSIATYIAATRITSCVAASRSAKAEHFLTICLLVYGTP